jgi:ATP-binding cassette subfamily B multidrug efflux pump
MSEHRPSQDRSRSDPPPVLGRRGGPWRHLMGEKERAKDTRGTTLRIWGYLQRQTWALGGVILLVAASSGFGLLGPYLMGKAIDEYILVPGGDLPGLARMAVLMLGAYLITSLTTWLQIYVMAGVAQVAVRDIRSDLFTRLQTLSLRYFDQHTHGELMSRLTNDVENISNILAQSVTQLIASLLSVVGVATMMFVINARLAIVSLVTIPMMMFLSRWIAKRTRRGFRQQQEVLGELNGIIEETITGQRVVKAYVREEAIIEQFDRTNHRLRRASTYAQSLAGTMGPLTNLVNNVGFAIVAGAGGWMAVQGLATVGMIASFVNYARQFARPLNQITALYRRSRAGVRGHRPGTRAGGCAGRTTSGAS